MLKKNTLNVPVETKNRFEIMENMEDVAKLHNNKKRERKKRKRKTMANKITQWNIGSAKANHSELSFLIRKCPPVICLQETFPKEVEDLNINNYTSYRYVNRNPDRRCINNGQ